MAEKEHVCTRMVRIIEENGLSVAQFENEAAETGIAVSGGYLRKAAKKGTNIGIDLLDYFLAKFNHVDANWLITGSGDSGKIEKKGTAATNSVEAAVLREAMAELREQLAFLRAQNSDLTKVLLQRKVVEESK